MPALHVPSGPREGRRSGALAPPLFGNSVHTVWFSWPTCPFQMTKCSQKHDICILMHFQTFKGLNVQNTFVLSPHFRTRSTPLLAPNHVLFLSLSVDGGWGVWSEWSACSVTCGTGYTFRSRKCDNPTPIGGGMPCRGSSYRFEFCRGAQCPMRGTVRSEEPYKASDL